MTADVVQWIDADGGSTTLRVDWDANGRGMTPVKFEEDIVPDQSGSRLRFARHDTRDMTLPITIITASTAALRSTLRSLIPKFDPQRGDGRIRVTSELGDQREIVCRYSAGLELAEHLGSSSAPRMQKAPITFRCFTPYWTDVSDTTTSYTVASPQPFFPFFPLRLSSSEIFAAGTVTNAGDVKTWPVWTLTGPGSAILLKNLTTGKVLTLNYSIGSSEVVAIDTREGTKSVTRNDGTNLFSTLSNTSALWPLERGSNSIQVEMTGSTGASSVALAYRQRYLTV